MCKNISQNNFIFNLLKNSNQEKEICNCDQDAVCGNRMNVEIGQQTINVHEDYPQSK